MLSFSQNSFTLRHLLVPLRDPLFVFFFFLVLNLIATFFASLVFFPLSRSKPFFSFSFSGSIFAPL